MKTKPSHSEDSKWVTRPRGQQPGREDVKGDFGPASRRDCRLSKGRLWKNNPPLSVREERRAW